MLQEHEMLLVLMLAVVAAVAPVAGDWASLTAGGSGPGTIYGYGQNDKGACSFGENMADTTGLPWSSTPAGASDGGTGLDMTFVALNLADFASGTSCGSCIWFRGTGGGIGVESRKISETWQYGLVDNICPECPKGALDLARSFDVGDGIWNVEWYAVPCQVGGSNLHYSFPQNSPYFFNMVVSNTRVPVASVSATFNGVTVELTRTSNNQWAYHNSDGSYSFPMALTITPVCGAAVTDVVESLDGGFGNAQFGTEGCTSKGNPTSGTSSGSELSTEATSVARATIPVAAAPPPSPEVAERALIAPAPAASPAAAPAADSPAPQEGTPPVPVPETEAPTPAPTPAPAPEPAPQPAPQPALEPTLKPAPEPAPEPTPSPTPKPTQSPPSPPPLDTPPAPAPQAPAPEDATRLLSTPPLPEATAAPTVDATVSETPAPIASVPQTDQSGDLFGGQYSENLGKAVLPAWYQCGDTQGRYPSVVCGNKGFSCVYVNQYYWQCRDDAGGPSVQGRRRLRSALRK